MDVKQQIEAYIAGQAPKKRAELQRLHDRIVELFPESRLWFLDGRNSDGKVVTNPNIGYGSCTIDYASGDVREFYKVGISANTSGISVYVMGLADKAALAKACGDRLGKAKVTGYCIKFRNLADIDVAVLEEIVARHLGGAPA